ncbi:MAG: M42 family metallopeptidase [Candidatus Nanohaloarchaea archaeon]
MKELLRELVEVKGGSGDEKRVRELIREKVEDKADEISEDNLGNLIVRRGSGDRTLMVAAHMDQISASVRKIDEEGFIHMKKMWGIDSRELLNQRVEINASDGDMVPGVIGQPPVHIQEEEEKGKIPDMEDLVVDIGAKDEEAAEELGIRVGDYIYYDRDLRELADDFVTAPAFDDRVGCAILIELVERFDEDYELVAVFTSQEEVGTKGAQTSAYSIEPDAGLAIDVTIDTTPPNIETSKYEAEIGAGPHIELVQTWGRGAIVPESVKDWLIETAEENDHDYNRRLGGGNDARAIYMTKSGIPTGSIGVPARSIHSPVEVVKMSDIEATTDFVEDAFSTMEDYF